MSFLSLYNNLSDTPSCGGGVLGISPLSSTDRWKPFYRWKPFFLIISMHVHIYYNPITSPSLSITVMHHKQQIQSNVNWLIKLSSYHWKGLDAMEGPCWLDLNSDLSYFGIYKGPFPAIKNLMQSVVIQPSTKNNVIFISLLLNFNFEKINKIHYGHNYLISQCCIHFLLLSHISCGLR